MSGPDRASLAAGYERGDLRPRRVLAIAALVLGSLVMVAGAAQLLSVWFGQLSAGATRGTLPVTVPPPDPHLLSHPQRALQQHLADKRSRLRGYGWVDREAGVAHIPIDRAMQLQVQRLQPEGAQP